VAESTELAPIVVDRVARRVATDHQRVARRLRYAAAAMVVLVVVLGFQDPSELLEIAALPTIVGLSAYIASNKRMALAAEAARIGEAAIAGELPWRYERGRLTSPDGKLALHARPTDSELRGLLPAARVVQQPDD